MAQPKVTGAVKGSDLKGFITPGDLTPEKQLRMCPHCGNDGTHIPPTEAVGRTLVVTYECTNGHRFKSTYLLK